MRINCENRLELIVADAVKTAEYTSQELAEVRAGLDGWRDLILADLGPFACVEADNGECDPVVSFSALADCRLRLLLR